MMNAKTLSLSATVWLLAAILIGVPGPWTGTASAAVNCSAVAIDCTADTDLDGIPDYYECNGFTWYRVATPPKFPGFTGRGTLSRKDYLDPDSKDLFLVVSRSASTLIPNTLGTPTANDNLFQDITEAATTAAGGLGVTLHYLADCAKLGDTTCAQSRQLSLSFGQWAVRVVEDSATDTGLILGSTPVGTPTVSSVEATVLTRRVGSFTRAYVCDNTAFCDGNRCYIDPADYITNPASVPFFCYVNNPRVGRVTSVRKDSLGTPTSNATLTAIIDLYQRQNVAHETGHMMNLVPEFYPPPNATTNVTTTPPHYASSETGSIMEASAYYKRTWTKSGGKINKVNVIWYMPASFVDTDRSQMRLR